MKGKMFLKSEPPPMVALEGTTNTETEKGRVF